MRCSVTVFVGLIASIGVAVAQPFSLSTTPQSITVTEAPATFKIFPSVQSGFKASIYVSAECPTLPKAGISISPSILNVPYQDTAVVTITLTGPKTGGTHDLYITARNGGALARDTVQITIPNRSTWRVFAKEEFAQHSLPLDRRYFALDKNNGIGWVYGWDSLRSCDGQNWNAYAWPDTSASHPSYVWPSDVKGMIADSTGKVSILMGSSMRGALLQRDDSSWTVIGHVDTAIGLTQEILSAMGGGGESFSNIQIDSDGAIWITGALGTLIKYDGADWTLYSKSNADMVEPDGYMLVDAMDNVWIKGSRGGINKFDGTYWTYILPNQSMVPISATPDGYIWLRTNNSTFQLHSDSTNGTFYPNIDPSFLGKSPTSIQMDLDGEYWVGLRPFTYSSIPFPGGIARFDGTSWYHYTVDNSGLPDNHVIDLKVDRNKNVWILTKDGSLTILDGNVPPNEIFTGDVSSVEGSESATASASIEVVPNPVSDDGFIRLHLTDQQQVKMILLTSLGQTVGTIMDGIQEPGDRMIPLRTDELVPGAYFLQLTVGTAVVTRPMLVTR